MTLQVWFQGETQYITIPKDRQPCNLRKVAAIVLCDALAGAGLTADNDAYVSYLILNQPTKQQVKEGQENWQETFE